MTSTPRVLVTHPSADMYGSDRVLLESVEGLVASGWDVTVTVPAAGPLVQEVLSRGAGVEICEAPVLRKSMLSPKGLVRLAYRCLRDGVRGLRLIRRVDPDVVLVNTVTVPLWPLLARLARRTVVVHVHEAEASARPLLRRVLGAPLLLAHQVMVNSQFSLGVLLDSWPRIGGRCTVVLNGVPGPSEVTSPRESLDGGVRLLYVGRLSPRKGVDVAVEAVAELGRRGVEANLDVVGAVFPGYEWFEEELRDAAAPLEGRVRLHGFATSVWPYLEAADVALVPSRLDEPFGNTAVEAVLAARPLVVSATSGLLEAASGYPTARSVGPGDPLAIADAVEALVADWTDVRRLTSTSRAIANDRHAPSVYGRQVSQIVEQASRSRR
ncbi:glycosyltransferase family 4 protein [Solicola sp. PLA-1-18]|uniref:glycosyltransferase family 4 protein n=1 Tax=Solicola sp. PLA-1-18 TaxID=3380532 RepID=UPI003B78E40A